MLVHVHACLRSILFVGDLILVAAVYSHQVASLLCYLLRAPAPGRRPRAGSPELVVHCGALQHVAVLPVLAGVSPGLHPHLVLHQRRR